MSAVHRKPGLTLERHRQIGERLKAIRGELLTLSVEVNTAYPLASKVGRAACRVVAGVSRLRCALDGALATEHPAEFSPAVYYGAEEPRGFKSIEPAVGAVGRMAVPT